MSLHEIKIPETGKAVISLDTQAQALYAQFSTHPVARTVDASRGSDMVHLDLDEAGELVGIEAIGMSAFSIKGITGVLQGAVPAVTTSQLEEAEIRPMAFA